MLIILSFFRERLGNVWVYRFAAAGALAVSVLNTVSSLGVPMAWLNALPLSSLGFGWVVPAAAAGILGFAMPGGKAAEGD